MKFETMKLTVRYDQHKSTDLGGQEAGLQKVGHQHSGADMSANVEAN